jgi:uncharacterized protein (UPF0332 family)
MDALDFLHTAELLKKETHEWHLRTSIGRSYYAIFLYFREWLKAKGLEKKIKPKQDAHAFVINCLSYSTVLEGQKASRYLKDLQQNREDCDYRLDMTFSPDDAENALTRARKAIAEYSSITSENAKHLVVNAMQHAKTKRWI